MAHPLRPQTSLRSLRKQAARDARLSALHWWRSCLGGGPRFRPDFPDRQRAPRRRLVVASRAEPRRRPGAVRARHDPRAPHQTQGSRLRPSMQVGGHDLRPKGRISGPNPTGFGPESPPLALHRSAPPQDASRSAPHERGARDLGQDRNAVKDYFPLLAGASLTRIHGWDTPPQQPASATGFTRFEGATNDRASALGRPPL